MTRLEAIKKRLEEATPGPWEVLIPISRTDIELLVAVTEAAWKVLGSLRGSGAEAREPLVGAAIQVLWDALSPLEQEEDSAS